MKKIIIHLLLLLSASASFSQVFKYSNEQVIAAVNRSDTKKLKDSIKLLRIEDGISCDSMIKRIESEEKEPKHQLQQKRLAIVQSKMAKEEKDKLIAEINEQIKAGEESARERKHYIKYWCKIVEDEEKRDGKGKAWFPAYYSSQSIIFFEDNTVHKKLFQNNLVNYNPVSKKMTLYSEAVNDYLGPVRVGIGFQVKSESETDSLSTVDSTQKAEKKDDLVSSLQNGGGDISISFQLPLIKTMDPYALIQSKFYLYASTGFSLPVLNKANEDFLFNYSSGIEGGIFLKGFNEKLTFFVQLKGGYYGGNSNYRKVIKDAGQEDPASFAMLQSSLGIDFLNKYRIKVDLYSGNRFIKKNFPATIGFFITP